MVDEPFSNPPGDPGGHAFFQNFQHTPVGARVPEKVGRGVFATAVMVLQTNEIFVLDMLCMASQPQQVVARIIMTAGSFAQFLAALQMNVKHYESEIGPLKPRFPAQEPTAHPLPGQSPPGEMMFGGGQGGPEGFSTGSPLPGGGGPLSGGPHAAAAPLASGPITDLYEALRFPEDLLGGTFANAVMIRHTPEEFGFDFISSLYPRPVVVSRVFAAAGRIPSFIEAMAGSMERYKGGESPGGQ